MVVRHPQGALCHVDHDRVICYDIARIVENVEERRKVLDTFNHCIQPDAEEITREVASKCCAVEIKIAEIAGRQQRGSERTCWRYRFDE